MPRGEPRDLRSKSARSDVFGQTAWVSGKAKNPETNRLRTISPVDPHNICDGFQILSDSNVVSGGPPAEGKQ